MKMSPKLKLLAALALTAAMAGCSTPTPPVVDTSLQSFKPLGYSTRDTCDTQKQIAAHNSVYDTLKTGKAVVYAAPCDQKPGQSTGAKTS